MRVVEHRVHVGAKQEAVIDPATTLCTFIADLTAGEAVIAARDDQPVTIPLPDLAEGRPHRSPP